MNPFIFSIYIVIIVLISCKESDKTNLRAWNPQKLQVAFLIMDGTYNTELTAPFDIFQHTKYRQNIQDMEVFTVAKLRHPITTFEGLRLIPDYGYLSDTLPRIDVLVVPSALHHIDQDLSDEEMLTWVKKISHNAQFVTSHCDGAFVLAKSGLLDSVACTTFPSDITKMREMFPHLDIRDSVWIVHDGKFITSAGGARSFEAALYLTDLLYGPTVSKDIAKGLVIDWDLTKVPFIRVHD